MASVMTNSQGSAALVAALRVDRELRRRVAYECRVTDQTVRNWEAGTSPRACYRATLQTILGIDWQSWEVPAAKRRRATKEATT